MAFSVAGYFHAAKIYRLAVLGPTNAGKTSLLAALGLTDRPPSPLGYTATRANRLPRLPDADHRVGEVDHWDRDRLRADPVRAFAHANRWVDDAEARLRAGAQPEGNPANVPPVLLVYQFTATGRGAVTVEVVEFAGELLNPNSTQAENRRALSVFLKAVDGLLVLAEAPYPDQRAGELAADLRVLSDAVGDWADGRRAGARVRVPVALVLTKWDCRGRPGESAGERDAGIARLLDESPAHARLWQAIGNLSPHHRRFAASAFGRSEPQQDVHGRPVPNTDCPVDSPLPSFGLEDPFVWACQESDRLAAEDLEATAARLRPWWAFWSIRSSWRARTAARVVRDRSPADPGASDGGERHRAASAVACRAGWLATAQAVVWLLLVVAGGLAVYLDRDAAAARREEGLWSQVDRADPAVRADPLRSYIERYPNGRYADDARRELAELERRKAANAERDSREVERRRRLAVVAQLRRDFEVARGRNEEAPLRTLNQEFDRLPVPALGVETDEDVRDRNRLGQDILAALAQTIKDAKQREYLEAWRRTKDRLDRDVERLELKQAANTLATCTIPTADVPQVEEARRGFGAAAVGAAERRVREGIEKRNWEWIDKLEAAKDDSGVKGLIPDKAQRDRLAARLLDLKRAKDRVLYEDFRAVPTRANAQAYLDGAPLKVMEGTIRAFLKYEDDKVTDQKLWLEVEWIDWKGWYDHDKNTIWLGVKLPGSTDYRLILDASEPSARNGRSGPLKSVEFRCKPADEIGLWLEVEAAGRIVLSSRLKGQVKGDKIATPEEMMINGGVIKNFEMLNGSDRGTQVKFIIHGVPAKPALGDWKE